MLSLLSPEYSGGALVDYGCTARGTLDPQSKNIGDPVSEKNIILTSQHQLVKMITTEMRLENKEFSILSKEYEKSMSNSTN